jgi:hypothetical protein
MPFIRFKQGRRAGEEVEMKFADAKPLLEDGRAELVYPADPAAAPAKAPAVPSTAPGAQPATAARRTNHRK